MSLSLAFYAGDADKIGAAFTATDFERLRNGSLAHAHAELSLDLSPVELDVLSEQAAGMLKRTPIHLMESLTRQVGGLPDESSADVVAPEWVGLMAEIPESSAEDLAMVWLAGVMAETGEEIDTNDPAAARSVAELLALCRAARARGTDVVFAWYL